MAIVEAMKSALPTSRHAQTLFDSVEAQIGPLGRVEAAHDGRRRSLYRRETAGSAWTIPWPLLRIGSGKRLSFVGTPDQMTDAVPESSGEPTLALRNLEGGEIVVCYGWEEFTATFADDGRWCESCRSSDRTLDQFVQRLGDGGGHAVDLLADVLADRDLESEAPGRLYWPEGCAAGLGGAWRTGLGSLREALFGRRSPPGATWGAADGYSGEAVGWGATRAEAAAACRAEIARLSPRPPEPVPPPELTPAYLESLGYGPDDPPPMLIVSPPSDAPAIEPTHQNTPIVVTAFGAIGDESSFGSTVVLLDDRGASYRAAIRQDEDGFTLVGEDILPRLALERLDDDVDQAIARWAAWMPPARPWPKVLPPLRSRTYTCRIDENGTIEVGGSSQGGAFSPRSLDGRALSSAILRQRQTSG